MGTFILIVIVIIVIGSFLNGVTDRNKRVKDYNNLKDSEGRQDSNIDLKKNVNGRALSKDEKAVLRRKLLKESKFKSTSEEENEMIEREKYDDFMRTFKDWDDEKMKKYPAIANRIKKRTEDELIRRSKYDSSE